MSLTPEAERIETYKRTNSLFKDAERMLEECRDRHSWCAGCQSEKACLRSWDKIVRSKDQLTMSVTEYNHYLRELQELEMKGYPLKFISFPVAPATVHKDLVL